MYLRRSRNRSLFNDISAAKAPITTKSPGHERIGLSGRYSAFPVACARGAARTAIEGIAGCSGQLKAV